MSRRELRHGRDPTDLGELIVDARHSAESVLRHSYGRLIAYLSARSGDVAGAEDALADAFAAALSTWPRDGVPRVPEAWLLTTARRRLVDSARRRQTHEREQPHLQLLAELRSVEDQAPDIPDDRLRLMFVCAHPAIDAAARAPLMLQTILGFDAATIASAFLVSPASMSQRLVRAKNKIRRAGIAFRLPDAADLAERLHDVLSTIYAVYTEGWVDPSAADVRRRNLADEALWLARLLVDRLPEHAEVLGLLALLMHCEARRPARRDAEGRYVRLADQDPAAWNHELIDQAERLLHNASTLQSIGRFQIEAAIQSAHNHRRHNGKTDWVAIERLYRGLRALADSPVAAVNHAMVIAQVEGPGAALVQLGVLSSDARLDDYQPFWAARAEILSRLGDLPAARDAYDRAIGLETDGAVRQFLHNARQTLDDNDGTRR